MKIKKIEVDRFGVWNNIALPLKMSGVNVLYGPNEAGKSTLMRFIRGVLYGFKDSDLNSTRYGRSMSLPAGALIVNHNGQSIRIQRVMNGTPRGTVTISGADFDGSPDEFLQEIVGHTEEKVFENVFAIGLHELQELATLHDADVAHHIYGMTLGPEGRQLLNVIEKLDTANKQFIQPDGDGGKLDKLFDRHDQLTKQLDSFTDDCQEHKDLRNARVKVEALIEDCMRRQTGLQSQLRGHLLMDRIWTPWNEHRQLQAELETLPVVTGFPDDGLERLNSIDNELSEAVNFRDDLLKEAKRFRHQADEIQTDSEIRKCAPSLQSCIAQRDWIGELENQVADSELRAEELRGQFQSKLEQLGDEWTEERIVAADTSPSSAQRMISISRKYRSATAHCNNRQNRYQRYGKRCQRRTQQLNDIQQLLGEVSIDDALATLRERSLNLEDLGRLRLRESELQQRRFGIKDHLARLSERPELPNWVNVMFCVWVVAGLIIGLIGVVTGVTTNAIAGAIYALLGATCGGVAWGWKTHAERNIAGRINRLQNELREMDARLSEARDAIERTTIDDVFQQRSDDYSETESPATTVSEAQLIKETTEQMSQLTWSARTQETVRSMRRRLSQMRSRFPDLQRDVAAARQDWCELLSQLGFSETVEIDEAFAVWQQVLDARTEHDRSMLAQCECKPYRQSLEHFRQRIEELGHRMHRWDIDYSRPLDVLTDWENQLQQYSVARHEQRRLRRDARARRIEARGYRDIIGELQNQRSALLVQGGATTREEFEERAGSAIRRIEIEALSDDLQAELELATQSEPELAVVEEDLLTFEPDHNTECIQTIQQELDDLEKDVQQSFEELGRVKQEIIVLESDRSATSLRYDLAQVATQLRRAVEQWFALQWASRTMNQIRTRFERTSQPAMLSKASRYFHRLCCGRYTDLWTPLGSQSLRIDDQDRRSFTVEQLSGGTREQLFLAIRLAIIQARAQEGVELPLVLDDVVVNFDQRRTEAVIDELIKFADDGPQTLFFTCHLHLTHLFESRGIEPIWLPNQQPPLEERRAG